MLPLPKDIPNAQTFPVSVPDFSGTFADLRSTPHIFIERIAMV